jgi:plasmid stability protein
MAQLIVRNIEAEVKTGLKQRAARHGWSMEEEVRQILHNAVNLAEPPPVKLGSRIAQRFAGIGLVEPLPELHQQIITPMNFGA